MELNYLNTNNDYFTKFKSDFEKSMLSAAKKTGIPTSKDFLGFCNMFYESLFIDHSLFWQKAITKFEAESSKNKIEKFLSITFYIFINKTIKYLYDNQLSWNIMQQMYKNMDKTINYIKLSSSKPKPLQEKNENTTEPNTKDIFLLFKKALKNKDSIKLYNTYKGIPIEKNSQVIRITDNALYIKPHPIQEAAAMRQEKIFIKRNSTFPYDLEAKFEMKIIKGEKIFKINSYQISKKNLIERKYIRINPKEPVFAKIFLSPQDQILQVHDLSLGGISLVKNSKILFSIPEETKISLTLPEICTIILQAHLIKVTKNHKGFTYHFNIYQDRKMEKSLSEFITRNQLQIIQELKENYILTKN